MTEEYVIVDGDTLADYIRNLVSATSMLRKPHVKIGIAKDPERSDPQWTLLLHLEDIGVKPASNMRNWRFEGHVLQWGDVGHHLHAEHRYTGEYDLDTKRGILRMVRDVPRTEPPMCMQCGITMIRAGSTFACPSCGSVAPET